MPQRDGTATDHTGTVYEARGRQNPEELPHRPLMRNPQMLSCPNCETTLFYIIADNSDHAVAGVLQFHCSNTRCRTTWPEMQMHVPQMNTQIKQDRPQSTTLWIPPIDETIEIPRS